jgi:hypothetical protein
MNVGGRGEPWLEFDEFYLSERRPFIFPNSLIPPLPKVGSSRGRYRPPVDRY